MLAARSLIVHILPIADLTVVLQTFQHLPSPGHIVAHPISTCRLKGHSTSLLFDISAAQLCSVAAKSATSIVSKHVWPNQSAHEIHDCSLSTLMLSLVHRLRTVHVCNARMFHLRSEHLVGQLSTEGSDTTSANSQSVHKSCLLAVWCPFANCACSCTRSEAGACEL